MDQMMDRMMNRDQCEKHREEYNRKGLEGMTRIIPSYIMDTRCQFFSVAEFERLMASGKVDVNQPCPMGYRTVHMLAATDQKHSPQLLEILLRYHPEAVNQRAERIMETPLMAASAFGAVECAKLLLKHRADPMAVDYESVRRTPANYAANSYARTEEIQRVIAEGEENFRSCFVCGTKEGRLNRCGGCKVAFYCGKEHQTSDWPTHKLLCASYKDGRSPAAEHNPNCNQQ